MFCSVIGHWKLIRHLETSNCHYRLQEIQKQTFYLSLSLEIMLSTNKLEQGLELDLAFFLDA
jgi:hypothetical protein